MLDTFGPFAFRQAQEDRLRDFDGAERHVYVTDAPVPLQWYVDVKQAARRHPEAINPRGLPPQGGTPSCGSHSGFGVRKDFRG